jgi:hypothetical protein
MWCRVGQAAEWDQKESGGTDMHFAEKIERRQVLKCESTRNWREGILRVRFWNI